MNLETMTFELLELTLQGINPENPIEQDIKNEFEAGIEGRKENPHFWDTPNDLMFNIIDEAHDGAYDEDHMEIKWDDDILIPILFKWGFLDPIKHKYLIS